MAMRKYHDFKSAKEIYIERVLYHIHYGRLKKRIKEEIENHMNDIYEDFKGDFDTEIEVTKKVIEEMGDPDELGLELKEANKTKLFIARLYKIAIGVGVIPLSLFAIVLIVNVWIEVRPYFTGTDIETKEMQIVENYNNGEPIHLLAEIEYDGIIYRYYLPDKEPENRCIFFRTQSIKVFGISVKDKFVEYGKSSGPEDNETRLSIGRTFGTDYLWILYGETKQKYVKRYYEPIDSDSELEPYWSDFITVPQYGTYENPVIIYDQPPEGYKWNSFKEYDENKEPVVYSDDEKKNNVWSAEATS